MSNNLTFAELDAQHVELLPARTVLSMISVVALPRGPSTPGVGHNSPVPSWCVAPMCVVHTTAGSAVGGLHG
jgi:hypothetical protein